MTVDKHRQLDLLAVPSETEKYACIIGRRSALRPCCLHTDADPHACTLELEMEMESQATLHRLMRILAPIPVQAMHDSPGINDRSLIDCVLSHSPEAADNNTDAL